MDISGRLAQANGRLRASNIGIAIEQRGNILWLRGTFPPKPNSDKAKPLQQRISLRTIEHPQGVKATIAGLQYAEQQARAISVQLDKGQFNWADWELQQETETARACRVNKKTVRNIRKNLTTDIRSEDGLNATIRSENVGIFKKYFVNYHPMLCVVLCPIEY